LKITSKGLHLADVAETHEAVTDELKKIQKEEFSAAFQKLYDQRKSLYICQLSVFWIKMKVCVFDFKKKTGPKTFGPHCV